MLAVATIYSVEIGSESAPTELPPMPKSLGRLKWGLLLIWAALLRHRSLPKVKSNTPTGPNHTKSPIRLKNHTCTKDNLHLQEGTGSECRLVRAGTIP